MIEIILRDRRRTIMRWVMALFYFIAGVVHLLAPDGFVKIVPEWVPAPLYVVIFTGICEIAGAVALPTQRLRRAAGLAFALYAICVFPANVKHAFDHIDVGGLPSSWWYHAPRLAAQPILVWWALYVGEIIDWPFGKKA